MKQDQIYKLTLIFMSILLINELRVESYSPPPEMFMSQITQTLARSLYDHVSKREGNVVCSPFGYSSELTAILSATSGKTEKELGNAIGFGHIPGLTRGLVLQYYKNETKDADTVNLNVANSVWIVDNKADVNPQYKSIIKEYLRGDVYPFHYYGNGNLETINMLRSWLTYKTGLHPIFFRESTEYSIMTHPSLIFLNTVLMNINFVGKRDGIITRPYYFKSLDDETDRVKMIFFKGRINYAKDSYHKAAGYQIVEIPYRHMKGGEEFCFLLAVPNEHKGVTAIDNIMAGSLNTILYSMRETENVIVGIPAFSIHSELNLNGHFNYLTGNFFYRKPNISKITKYTNNELSYVLQSATIQVDSEDGVDSTDPIPELSDARYIKVIADRPFFFFVRKTSKFLWHFVGRVTNMHSGFVKAFDARGSP